MPWPAKPSRIFETLKRLTTMQGYREQATIAEDVFLGVPGPISTYRMCDDAVGAREIAVGASHANEQSSRERSVALTNTVFLGSEQVLALSGRKFGLAPANPRP